MNLIDLPEEIIRNILQNLDIKSIQSLYETCKYLRSIILMHGSVKKCKMSLSTMATTRILKTRFLKDISPFIQELDMSAVPDFSKPTFLAALKKFRKLKTLNVSYTPLKLDDLADLHDTCPNLKNICATFDFTSLLSLLKIQDFFEKVDNVHFTGSLCCLLYTKLVFIVLRKAKLNVLKLTVLHTDQIPFPMSLQPMVFDLPYFKQFYVCVLNRGRANSDPHVSCIKDLEVIKSLDLNQYEFIILSSPRLTFHSIFVSKLFMDFFNDHFNLNPCCVSNLNDVSEPRGNVNIMLWRKDVTKFDDIFFGNLLNDLKDIIPYCVKQGELSVPNTHDWFVVTPMIIEKETTSYEPKMKRKRVGVKKHVLDYDILFKHKDKIQLNFDFSYLIRDAITLSTKSNYLSKITYLSLSGIVRYSPEFFNLLFRSCTLLKTLNVEAPALSPCCQSICRSLPLSRSLSNFRLVDKSIDFKAMFSALCQCRNIENIFISEASDITSAQFADPSLLFQNCDNLFNLHISFTTSTNSYKNQWQPMFNKAISKYNKQYVNLVLYSRSERPNKRYFDTYDSFINVFRLNPIRDI